METEALLQPISPENPCGDDLSYDVSLQELDMLLRGKEETQFSAAEDPDWKQVRDQCAELFRRSKDLRIAVTLCLALMKLESLPGLRDGFSLLRSLIQNYWTDVYPRLDPDDDNDPVERMNILAGITKPLGTFGDSLSSSSGFGRRHSRIRREWGALAFRRSPAWASHQGKWQLHPLK